MFIARKNAECVVRQVYNELIDCCLTSTMFLFWRNLHTIYR